MNRYALFAFSLFVIWGIAYATGCDITLPVAPVLVEPDTTPVPSSETIGSLSADQFYVVESDTELITLTSPEGFVDIEASSGPIRVRGLFVDGANKIETRIYSSPFIYFVTAKASGKTELILIPHGVTSQADIVRQVLTVSGGGPKPPPDDDTKPKPQPTVKNVSIAIVEDTMNRSPDMAILMNQMHAWTAFVDSGNDWRSYDLTTGEPKGKQAITDLNGPAPGIVIYDKANRTMIHRGNMPATFAEFKTLIGSLTGG